MSTFDISSLPESTRAWLEAKLIADNYDSVDAYLRELICTIHHLEVEEDEMLRQEVALGAEQLDRGEVAPGKVAFDRLRAEHTRRFGGEAESQEA